MKIVTWNVNSLRVRAPLLELYLDAEQPDVVALQELKLPADRVPTDVFLRRGYELAIHSQPQWNGVLIASRIPIRAQGAGLSPDDEGQARLVWADLGACVVINVYCPQGEREDSPKFPYKLRFFDGLARWLGERPLADTLLVGDLNIAPEARDIWDPAAMAVVPSFHPLEHERWRALLGLGLTDAVRAFVPPGAYSFWDYRAGAFARNLGMRIDHILAGPAAAARVQAGGIDREWRRKQGELTPSDHAPVWVQMT